MRRVANPSFHGPAVLGLLALGVLVLVFGLWSVTATLEGAVVTRGRIEADQSRQPVQHLDGGVVAEVRVAEGTRVAAGEVLLVLDGAALRSELGIVDLRLDELSARSARLLAERDGTSAPVFPPDLLSRAAANPGLAAQIEGQRSLFLARQATQGEMQAQLGQRIVQVRAEVDGLVAQRQALAEQLDLVRQELVAQETLLARGLVAQSVVLALRRDQARIMGQVAELRAREAVAAGQIIEIGLQITGLAALRREEAATELREVEPVHLELLARQAALVERIARLELRAPVAGIVMGLAVTAPGAVLRAADPALSLVPTDRPLVIFAGIAPIHIDEVAPGQRADLAFLAFAARDAPRLEGRVTLVAPDALVDPASGVAQFQVRIEIDPVELARLGEQVLVPGMPVEVYLATRARTPLAYLTDPFSAYFTRALREG